MNIYETLVKSFSFCLENLSNYQAECYNAGHQEGYKKGYLEAYKLRKEDLKKESLYCIKITDSNLPSALVKSLTKVGIDNFGDLARMSDSDLLKISGIGIVALEKIKSSMRENIGAPIKKNAKV